MALENEQEITNRRNVPRFFVEHPHISWILLAGVLIWGWFGYTSMPQRKDPDIPVRLGVAACPWPGATAQQVEQYITRRIEDVAAENKTIHPGTDADYGIKSISLPGFSFVTIQLDEGITDTKRQFSDINLKLDALNAQLPQGAGPITFQSDFGDTAALMLTVASPKADDIEIVARANSVEAAIRKARDAKRQNGKGQRITVVDSFPQSISPRAVLDTIYLFQEEARTDGIIRDSEIIQGSGFIGVDGVSEADDSSIQAFIQRFISERLKRSELHPDTWEPAIIRDPGETRAKLAKVAG
ncbi:MAG: efflux RND transporter permease subunit, partial [Candidatus Acidiferrum sp.]